MLSKTSKAYDEVRAAHKELRDGCVLSIDPSIGSQSSMPGWAAYSAGVLKASGTVEIDPSQDTPTRLQRLNYSVRKLIQEWEPDVMVYEAITDVPYQGFSARGHAPLQKALGAILSVSGPEKYVGILAASWKKMVRDTYIKGDEADAIELGWVAIQEAHRIANEDPPRRYGQRRNSGDPTEGGPPRKYGQRRVKRSAS